MLENILNEPIVEAYGKGYEDGAKYVLQYLADVFEGVEDTDVWTDFIGNDKENND